MSEGVPSPEDAEPSTDTGEFDAGRYLYCVVDVTGTDAELPSLSGVDDGRPALVVAGDIGAVVHPCDSQYDSADLDTVREWLRQHQGVVDASGEAFGTPLPFRFDTVLKGDDEQVREWLGAETPALSDALAELAGQWEYRVELVWDVDELADAVGADDVLDDLRERIADADEGTAFLLEKQYDERRTRLLDARREDVVDSLRGRLDGIATEVQSVDRSVSPLREAGDDAGRRERDAMAVLAPTERESAIGDYLDDVASNPAIEVRFTGPWPPYSFAPTVGGNR